MVQITYDRLSDKYYSLSLETDPENILRHICCFPDGFIVFAEISEMQ